MIARDRIVELEDERNAAMAALAFCQDLAKAMIAERDEARARIAAALALCDEWFADDGVDQYVKRAGREVVDILAGPVTDTP